jgi:pilus assembly protein CpaF
MEGEVVVMNEVFCFEQTGAASDSKVTGQLRPTGIRPHFTSRLEQGGFKLPPELFGGGVTDRPRRW